jgi:hypothetical protein
MEGPMVGVGWMTYRIAEVLHEPLTGQNSRKIAFDIKAVTYPKLIVAIVNRRFLHGPVTRLRRVE